MNNPSAIVTMNNDKDEKVDLFPPTGCRVMLTTLQTMLRLAKVRENQQRSRARKQQYVQELEQTLASFASEAEQKVIERRIILQKLEAENRQLRIMLNQLGFDSGYLNEYFQEDKQSTATTKIAIPSLKKVQVTVLPSTNKCSRSRSVSDHNLPSDFGQTKPASIDCATG